MASADEILATFREHRALLFSIAYRMTGNSADAEDMLQETFIRWQGAAASEIQSPRAFLVTIISRLCINHMQSARIRREEYVGYWLPEPLLTTPDESTANLTTWQVVVRNGNHFPMCDDPDHIARTLDAFYRASLES